MLVLVVEKANNSNGLWQEDKRLESANFRQIQLQEMEGYRMGGFHCPLAAVEEADGCGGWQQKTMGQDVLVFNKSRHKRWKVIKWVFLIVRFVQQWH